MKTQNERKEWNERWQQQIEEWEAKLERLLEEAEHLLGLIQAAMSQIMPGPPE